MPKKSAVEVLIFRPFHKIPPEERGKDGVPAHPLPPIERGCHENLRIKDRFEQFLSVGVYLEGSQLKYYNFQEVDSEDVTVYNSLNELKASLPADIGTIFEDDPKLFVMAHGHGGIYGLSNIHGPSEVIHDENFDSIITDFVSALPDESEDIAVTLEACNTDNQKNASDRGQESTFLERLSANHPTITFGGSGPWDPSDVATGYRSSGGFPTLRAAITSQVGNIWKHGNSVIFHHEDIQLAVRKSMFATTETAKSMKINTVDFATEILSSSSLSLVEKDSVLQSICKDRDILRIEDLSKIAGFPDISSSISDTATALIEQQKVILDKEKARYLSKVTEILAHLEADEKCTDRDLLTLLLGLKDITVFDGHEALREAIFSNKELLQQLMVSTGKVLVAGPENDLIIDRLLELGVDINSTDEKGMTTLHYATQAFYNYREEPLKLIGKLVDSGADLDAVNGMGQTPLQMAEAHCLDQRVMGKDDLIGLLKERKRLQAVAGDVDIGASSYGSVVSQLGGSAPGPTQAHPDAELVDGEGVVHTSEHPAEVDRDNDITHDSTSSPATHGM